MNVIRTSAFNTNNSWGFGGQVGRSKEYDNGLTLIAARNYCRHAPSYDGSCVYVAVDEGKDAFKVQLRKNEKSTTNVKNLEGVDIISVLRYNDSHHDNYLALIGDFETVTKWGWVYTRIRTITLTKKQ